MHRMQEVCRLGYKSSPWLLVWYSGLMQMTYLTSKHVKFPSHVFRVASIRASKVWSSEEDAIFHFCTYACFLAVFAFGARGRVTLTTVYNVFCCRGCNLDRRLVGHRRTRRQTHRTARKVIFEPDGTPDIEGGSKVLTSFSSCSEVLGPESGGHSCVYPSS
jgi:hypothetical protein